MSEPIPTRIALHRQSRTLEVAFEGGDHYHLPCEYLRVYSPAAEVKVDRAQGRWPTGKEEVNIDQITPVGSYAVQITFDDGHETGVYSWKTLHELGRDHAAKWQTYLDALRAQGYERGAAADSGGLMLYFAALATRLGKKSEAVKLMRGATVNSLLAALRARGGGRDKLLVDGAIKVTVNRQFAAGNVKLSEGDEVAIVPGPNI
jgi:DUF971 family protein/molybdopterin converting factor small subunit